MLVAVALRSLSTFFIVLGAVLAALHIYFAGQPKPADLLDAIVDVVKSSMGFAKAFTGSCADDIPSLSPILQEQEQEQKPAETDSETTESLKEDEMDEMEELPETVVTQNVSAEEDESESEEEESEEEDV